MRPGPLETASVGIGKPPDESRKESLIARTNCDMIPPEVVVLPWKTILQYARGAALFAAAACCAWLIVRRLTSGRPWSRRDLLHVAAVGYAAALIQIIGLRIGLRPVRLMGGQVRLIPMRTTLDQWRRGLILYHIGGNMAWFVPLGMLLPRLFPRCRRRHALLAGAGLSLCLEALQFMLGTGISDIDDVIFNALGALAGYGLMRAGSLPGSRNARGEGPPRR